MALTIDQIKAKVSSDARWTERAIVALFEYQTRQEQTVEESIETNGVGFNKPDASRMSYYARWIQRGNHLSDRFLEDAKNRVVKYSGQLARIQRT